MRFKAIFMDNDGTLMDFKAAESNALQSVLKMLKIDDPDAAKTYSVINDQCWKDFEQGIITQAELRLRRFRELMQHYGCKCNGETVRQAAEEYVAELANQSVLLPGALDVVRKISEKLPILILTNGISAVQHGRIDRSPLAPYISGLMISTEVGAPKPAPDMYLKALEAVQAEPHEVLMIGDSLSSDIQGANNAGIPACWYNPEHKPRPEGISIDFEIDRIDQMVEVALMN